MLQLVLSMSAFIFVLTLIVFSNKAKHLDNKNRRLNAIKGSNKNILNDEFEKPFVERAIIPIFTTTIKFLSSLLPKRKGDKVQKNERNLKLAGFSININEYNAVRVMLAVVCLISALAIIIGTSPRAATGLLIISISITFALLFPTYFLKYRINRRQEEVTNQLPDVMDLLCVSIEAGLGFDSALVKIGERLNGILVDELNTVLSEIQLGKPRRVALRNLSDRSPVEELRTFISALIQAEQLGIPIKNVLNTQSQQLRINRRQKAEEKAMKAPVKMMLPLVIFVFPVLFIILLGPTVLQLLEQFGH